MSDGLVLMVVGMTVVFATLALLLGAILLLPRILAGFFPMPQEEEAKKTAKEPIQTREKQIDSQLIAILTAAATAA